MDSAHGNAPRAATTQAKPASLKALSDDQWGALDATTQRAIAADMERRDHNIREMGERHERRLADLEAKLNGSQEPKKKSSGTLADLEDAEFDRIFQGTEALMHRVTSGDPTEDDQARWNALPANTMSSLYRELARRESAKVADEKLGASKKETAHEALLSQVRDEIIETCGEEAFDKSGDIYRRAFAKLERVERMGGNPNEPFVTLAAFKEAKAEVDADRRAADEAAERERLGPPMNSKDEYEAHRRNLINRGADGKRQALELDINRFVAPRPGR